MPKLISDLSFIFAQTVDEAEAVIYNFKRKQISSNLFKTSVTENIS